jgi:hypothetical protein
VLPKAAPKNDLPADKDPDKVAELIGLQVPFTSE